MSRMIHPDRAPVLLKSPVFRSEALRRAVSTLPCQCCGIQGFTQAAHSNLSAFGKGLSLKASDSGLMALCAARPGNIGCHAALDQLVGMTAAEGEALTHRWIASTLMALIEAGTLQVAK